MITRLTIQLFGQPAIRDVDGEAIQRLGPGKPMALLAYLIVNGKTSREQSLALLWGDMPEAKARNAFRQALHRLRAVLGDAIPHDPDTLSLTDAARAQSDVWSFDRARESGHVDDAIALYSGDFLSGIDLGEPPFEAWQEAMRKRYRAKFRDVLQLAIQRRVESGDLPKAVELARRLGESVGAGEEGAILYANTLLTAGLRSEALNALEEFEARHQKETGNSATLPIKEFISRLRLPPAATDPPDSGRIREPFVGRDSEIATLLSRLKSLDSGKGGVLVLEGEAGIGKSRLLDEFFSRARDMGGSLLLLGREPDSTSGIAFACVAEALRGALGAPGLSGTGQHLLAEAARLVPQLRDRFSLPATSDVVDEASRLRFFEGVAALLDSVAYEQPVCVALEDFHNCPDATFRLVRYLIERLAGAPILFILVARGKIAFVSRLKNEPQFLTVKPLSHEASCALARELVGPSVPEETIQQIAVAAGGVPFRIRDLSDRVMVGRPIGDHPLPMREVLRKRLQHCSRAEQRLFVACALFDRAVSLRLLAAAAHLSEKNVLDAALRLERAALVVQRPNGVMPAHSSSGELALEGVGPAAIALLAGWAAEALEEDRSGTHAELARLYMLAGRREKAFAYSRAAGFAAASAGELEVAAHHFKTAAATAPSAADRAELSVFVQALEGRVLQLTSGPANAERASVDPGPVAESQSEEVDRSAVASSPPETGASGRAQAPRKSRRVTPKRMLLGGIVAVAIFLTGRAVSRLRVAALPGVSLRDTLVVVEDAADRSRALAYTTGRLGSQLHELPVTGTARSWIDSLRLPWINPRRSPDNRYVAVERVTRTGSQVFLFTASGKDTIPLAVDDGDNIAAGWSPDSRRLLVTHGQARADGAYDADLYAYSIIQPASRIAIDTSEDRGVVDAGWAPDGTHIAWTARLGPQHQQDVFVSDADGANVRNVSDDPGEDYNISWAPDGSLIAFTSERTGRAELFSRDLADWKLRRLTWDASHADHAAFSPDGRWIAYESSQRGTPAVYVMPAGGGTGRLVSQDARSVSLIGWRGQKGRYLERISITGTEIARIGDSGEIRVRGFDALSDTFPLKFVTLRVLDPQYIKLASNRSSPSNATTRVTSVVGLAQGLARVTANAGNWRADTAFIPVGTTDLTLLEDGFENGLKPSAWRALGKPAPSVERLRGTAGSSGLVTNSDREWESGVLSTVVFPARGGLTAKASVTTDFAERPRGGKSFTFALVAADPAEAPDSVAPQFLQLAAISWSSVAGRLRYAVGREIFTEPVNTLRFGADHQLEMSVTGEGFVIFSIDGVLRWRSTLRVPTSGDNSRAQLWLASQAAGSSVVFDNVRVRIELSRQSRTNTVSRP